MSSPQLPRIAITYCTQCKWLLRAAYYAQELLSTFGTSIGEIALIPSTGGIFTVDLVHSGISAPTDDLTSNGEDGGVATTSEVRIWDRKVDDGFPETKVLKQKVRDVIEPGKGLGHSDTPGRAKGKKTAEGTGSQSVGSAESQTKSAIVGGGEACEDCK